MQVGQEGAAYKRVLVTLDGSPSAEEAIPHALAQARTFGAELILLQVLPTLLSLPGTSSTTRDTDAAADEPNATEHGDTKDAKNDKRQAARTYLHAVADNMRRQGVRTTYRVRRGPVAATILREAAATHADLVVMTTHGAGRLTPLVVGSVASQIVSRAPCPVLLIRVSMAADVVEDGVRSFEDDSAHFGLLIKRPLGIRTVALNRIVGSVGRASDLKADFLPPNHQSSARYKSVLKAMEQGVILQPVELYKLGYDYYVLDGNHRVAAAKALGQTDIDADVTEYLEAENNDAHRVYLERRGFESATGLTRVGATRAGHYPRLEALIRAYGEREGIADLRDAAQRWYARIYRPLAIKLRRAQLTRIFPGERTADLFVHLDDLHAREAEHQGHRADHQIDYEDALRMMLARYRSGRKKARLPLPGLGLLLKKDEEVTAEA